MYTVGLNGRSLVHPEPGGAVRIGLWIAEHLFRQCPDISFFVFVPRGHARALQHWQILTNVQVVETGPRGDSLISRAVWEQVWLPMLAGTRKLDAFLSLVNSGPVWFPVATQHLRLVHDVGFTNTKWFSRLFSAYLSLQLILGEVMGTRYATVSEFSREEMRAVPGRINCDFVVSNPLLKSAPPEQVDECISEVPEGPFLLFVGSWNPRKNLSGLVEAFSLFQEEAPGRLELAIAGAEKHIFQTSFQRDVPHLRILGFVSDSLKDALYRRCAGVVLPSFYEGFGLPILEAMQFGKPVFASSIPVFTELFGDAIHYMDPHDPSDMASTLIRHYDEQGNYLGDKPAQYAGVLARFEGGRIEELWRSVLMDLLES